MLSWEIDEVHRTAWSTIDRIAYRSGVPNTAPAQAILIASTDSSRYEDRMFGRSQLFAIVLRTKIRHEGVFRWIIESTLVCCLRHNQKQRNIDYVRSNQHVCTICVRVAVLGNGFWHDRNLRLFALREPNDARNSYKPTRQNVLKQQFCHSFVASSTFATLPPNETSPRHIRPYRLFRKNHGQQSNGINIVGSTGSRTRDYQAFNLLKRYSDQSYG